MDNSSTNRAVTSYKNNPRTQLQLSAAVEEYEWIRSFFLYVSPILTAITISSIYLLAWPLLVDEIISSSSSSPSPPTTEVTSSKSITVIVYFLLERLVTLYPFKSMGVVCLVVLTLASYYGLYRIIRFLPTIFEPCYEVRILSSSFVTFQNFVNTIQRYHDNTTKDKAKFTESIYKYTLPVKYPSMVHHNPYIVAPKTTYTNTSPPPTATTTPLIDQRTGYELILTEDNDKNHNNRDKYILVAKYSDRLGNHLFQYIYCRLRAMYLDISFVSSVPLGSPFQHVSCFVGRWNNGSNKDSNRKEELSKGLGANITYDAHEYLLRPRTYSHSGNIHNDSFYASLNTVLSSISFTTIRNLFLNEPVCKYAMYVPLYTGLESLIYGWLRPSIDKVYQEQEHTKNLSKLKILPLFHNHNNNPSLFVSPSITIAREGIVQFEPTDICIHVRLGDILWGAHASYRPLPMSFYRQSIDRILQTFTDDTKGGHSSSSSVIAPLSLRIIIVTEDASNPLIVRMTNALYEYIQKEYIVSQRNLPVTYKDIRILIQSKSITEDFLTLTRAPNIILSISSFVWWAATLNSTAKNIIIPECGMFVSHRWQPAPRTQPHVYIRHDLSVPWLVPDKLRNNPTNTLLQHSPSVSASTHDNIAIINRLIERYKKDLSVIQDKGIKHKLNRSPNSVESTTPTTTTTIVMNDFPNVIVRTSVHVISLIHLSRWPGHKKEAIESLFD